jgi:hypothetical protein
MKLLAPSDHCAMYDEGSSYWFARMNVGAPVRANGCS